MANDPLEDLIGKIARRNGVAIGKDDPIMIVHTLIEHLLEASRNAQEQALQDFRAELETLADTWGSDVQRRAEAILTAALSASTERMEEVARAAGEGVRKEIQHALRDQEAILDRARWAAWISVAGGALALVAVIVLVVGLSV